MKWVWQDNKWPNFTYSHPELDDKEAIFNQNIGIVIGAMNHLAESNHSVATIDILTQEAVSTSSIEGEILRRDSVQSSIRKHMGLKIDRRNVDANEAGMAELMVNLYYLYRNPLDKEMLCDWNHMVCNGRRDLDVIGDYRKHAEPMQVVGGSFNKPKVFYEAPPSSQLDHEMEKYISWYNRALSDRKNLPNLAFAGMAHLYFEMIHPFEDGNGRIGRALVEKSISQRINRPALNSFAKVIDQNKKEYYNALKACNHHLDISSWLHYFTDTIIASQEYTINLIKFIIDKSKFFTKHKDINQRQEKVLVRVFEEGMEGFKGGLSANNYQTIAQTSPATATRDLQVLVNMGALAKSGELKSTRYWLNLQHL